MPNLIDPRDPLDLILSTYFFVGLVVALVVVDVVVVFGFAVDALEKGDSSGFSVDVKIRDSSVRSATDADGLNFEGRGDDAYN